MIEKMMIDEKTYYLFGRNSLTCDFVIDHASCSRVHAALVYHKHLNRSFIIDLNSTHGTYLGSIRLERKKPQQVPIDSTIRFGASTRAYILREKPQNAITPGNKSEHSEKQLEEEEMHGGLLGLPEEETELANLTEFNTAHNKRLTAVGIEESAATEAARAKRKRKHLNVVFSEDDEIINPEDIDPSVGRFRNLVQTSVVPVKKRRSDNSTFSTESINKRLQGFNYNSLYSDLPQEESSSSSAISPTSPKYGLMSSTLSFMHTPNLAPDVNPAPSVVPQVNPVSVPIVGPVGPAEPKKKYFPKEAWPGKKPTPSLLI
ncbi:nuclear inhibitor of protein phosphatase 1-like [Antedon mediterranea]|uniref:nuclear inhibitor of protein phosphatase 1-like n=1 Tax=Antedon mediterranea TaxID=105859 RepID=UPI003AF56FD8